MNDETDNGIVNLYWFRLIETLKKYGKIDIGSTIPYLIGARRYKERTILTPSDSISDLILNISNSNEEYVGVLQFCATIQQVVIGLTLRENIENHFTSNIIIRNSQGLPSMISILDSTYGETVEDIIVSLVKTYSYPISQKKYSWDSFNEDWGQISEEELEIIEHIPL